MSALQVTSDEAVFEPQPWQSATEPNASPSLQVQSFGLTDRGKVRPNNEDQFLIATLAKSLLVDQTSLAQPKVQHSADRGHLFVVADGMGGHAGGETASALAVDSIEAFLLEHWSTVGRPSQPSGRAGRAFSPDFSDAEDAVLPELPAALGRANDRVLAEAEEHPELRGMGTTMTVAYSVEHVLFVTHVGDSRCYLCRDGVLHRLTRDHTLAEEMVREGVLAPSDVPGHHWRHVVTNAVGGGSAEVRVELHKVRLEHGDILLLCSDGLTEMVAEGEIRHELIAHVDPEQACRALISRAIDAGGKDNVTVVVARYEANPA